MLPAGLFFGLNITLFFTALGRTSIAHAEFITALSPILLVPLGVLLFHERPDRRALPWGLVTLVGLAIVLFLGGSQGGATLERGPAIVIVVVATWIGYLLTGRRARATVDVVDFMATMMPIGVLTATPVALVIAGDEIWPMTAKGWLIAAVLAVLTGMVGHGLIAFAQREVDVGDDRDHPGRPAGARRLLELPDPRRADLAAPRSPAWSSSSSGSSPSRSSASAAGSVCPLRLGPTNTGSSRVRWAERVAAATDPRT